LKEDAGELKDKATEGESDFQKYEEMAKDESSEGKQKLTEAAQHMGVAVDPNDTPQQILEKMKSKGTDGLDAVEHKI
jgi:hypothetical protein